MKISTLAISAVIAAAAGTTGVVAYDATAPEEQAASAAPAPGVRKPARTVLADCPKGTVPKPKVCLRIKEETVTQYVAGAAAPPLQTTSNVPTSPTTTRERVDHEGERDDHDDSPSDDHGDDHDDWDDDDHDDDHDDDSDDDSDDDDHDDDSDDDRDDDDDDHDDDDRDDDDRDDDDDDSDDDDRDDD